ncbi:nucleotidyltransferase domain-containing protein [Marispirochaeta sp.]|uniref:nucleotidyltransferase family protein n=1 Tax=Marispirochaeta sp. TaxID=2038653 RepID=UPI0029C886E8|nr:nucleotidyltransferase domain-containing protein [Marispirochaeta sp.]
MPKVDTGLQDAEVKRILAVFRRNPKIREILLFGSRAKGNYQKGSDIDIALSADGLGIGELLQIKSQLDDLMLPYKIDVVVYEDIQNRNLREHIDRVGFSMEQIG